MTIETELTFPFVRIAFHFDDIRFVNDNNKLNCFADNCSA